MLLIHCPYCGPRPELEFKHGGEAHVVRDPSVTEDGAWGAFLYTRTNARGIIAERWRHSSGCGRFFNCLRDSVSDRILETYESGRPRPALRVVGGIGETPADPSVAATEAFR